MIGPPSQTLHCFRTATGFNLFIYDLRFYESRGHQKKKAVGMGGIIGGDKSQELIRDAKSLIAR